MEILDAKTSLITENLNPNQLLAVTSNSPSTLVIAGAGSGKTSVLTRRVSYLITKGNLPGEVLCLTFTNKAAKEMRERVNFILQKVGINIPYTPTWEIDYQNSPLLCTFHSLGVRILREFGDKVALKSEFNILDSDDQKKIISEIIKELNIDRKNLHPSLALYFISKCKQTLLKADQSSKLGEDFLPVFHQIYKKYEIRLQESMLVDFDDLILLPYKILNENPDVVAILENRWKHILVDEFQDTNPAQFAIVKLLSSRSKLNKNNSKNNYTSSLFVVGDDAQSIYGFRGSKVEIILNFDKEYPKTQEIILNQNYRSTKAILDLAEQILTHNPFQKPKELFTDLKNQDPVKYYIARNEKDEAEYIIKELYKKYIQNDTNPTINRNFETGEDLDLEIETSGYFTASDMFDSGDLEIEIDTSDISSSGVSAMFDVYLNKASNSNLTPGIEKYNPNSWTPPIIDWSKVPALNESVVLYRTHAQSRSIEEVFLKYKLPYRLVSGVRFLERKEIKDVISILRFLSNGEDKFSLSRFLPFVLSGVGPKTLEKILAYLDDFEYPLAQKYKESLLELLTSINSCWQSQSSLIDLTKDLLQKSGYMLYLKTKYPEKEEYNQRLENIGELYSLMHQFDSNQEDNLPVRLQKFLEQVTLMSKLEDEDGGDTPKINLMSLHQSKGLEFENVFLIGCEDTILPHQNSLNEKGGIEEEVRLAYVGVTRAKRNLHLLAATSRVHFGQIRSNPISRIFRPFLDKYAFSTKEI